ncbi:MAG: malonate decarboxylase subunit alpha [Thermodesulfobacteriota bacterium]
MRTGKVVEPQDAEKLLLSVIRSGDRVVIEGDNQKQAAFLAKKLAGLPPEKVHDLHLLMSSVTLDDHLELFRKKIAKRLDFAFSGQQAVPLAGLAREGVVNIGSIHTYLELFSRYFTDLIPNVALVCAEEADADGNLFTGPNSEETPVLCEATHFGRGKVIAQVTKVVEKVTRVDIPGDQVDFVIPTGEPNQIQALFTRDPAKLNDTHVLMAMMVIKGIYAEYGVQSLNHGIGFSTAAIELLLPTYAMEQGLKGKICSHWALNPHPTLIPAIEAGMVTSIHSFGSEPGMDDYIASQKNVFFTSPDGVLKSSRCLCQMVGFYDCECFVGATLQIDADGNSSTAIQGRISGFGGAPNLGSNAVGRRHVTPAWLKVGKEMAAARGRKGVDVRGHKLIVQLTPTVSAKKNIPVFVDELDANQMAEQGIFELPPVMIYGDDITHIVTEKGIAYLCRCGSREERRAAIRAVAGQTPVGEKELAAETAALRKKKIVAYPEDLGIQAESATTDRLAAKSISDLVDISGGRFHPLPQFL